jgi:hypothetical protein
LPLISSKYRNIYKANLITEIMDQEEMFKPVKMYNWSLLELGHSRLENILSQKIEKHLLSEKEATNLLSIYSGLKRVSKLFHEGRDALGTEITTKIYDIYDEPISPDLEVDIVAAAQKILNNKSPREILRIITSTPGELINIVKQAYADSIRSTERVDSIIGRGLIQGIDEYGHSPEAILLHGIKIKDEEYPLLDKSIPQAERNKLRQQLNISPNSHIAYLDGGVTWKKSLYNEPPVADYVPPNRALKFNDAKLHNALERLLYIDKSMLTDPDTYFLAHQVKLIYDPEDERIKKHTIPRTSPNFNRTARVRKYGNMRHDAALEITILIPDIYAFTSSEETGHIGLAHNGEWEFRTDDPTKERNS